MYVYIYVCESLIDVINKFRKEKEPEQRDKGKQTSAKRKTKKLDSRRISGRNPYLQ